MYRKYGHIQLFTSLKNVRMSLKSSGYLSCFATYLITIMFRLIHF